jgi:hypothetical protein
MVDVSVVSVVEMKRTALLPIQPTARMLWVSFTTHLLVPLGSCFTSDEVNKILFSTNFLDDLIVPLQKTPLSFNFNADFTEV